VVAEWSDREVARRWWMLCPLRKDDSGQAEEPTEADLNAIRGNQKKLEAVRSRLSDISWWMRLLSQTIAQRANREDKENGKFWQARYKAVRLLDETSLLACAAYVDLNPIRAALAQTLEASDYTSVQKRLWSRKAAALPPRRSKSASPQPLDGYLAPLTIHERTDPLGPRCHRGGLRCSDKGFLPLSTEAYLELLDWTARQVRSKQSGRGRTPPRIRPIFERLAIGGDVWCELVRGFGRLFYAVAGKPQVIDARRTRDGRRRYKAKREVRELLAA
jgi:hypothetical protein